MLNKMKRWKGSKERSDEEEKNSCIHQQPIPGHIAIIMDGNGRWAKNRTLPRIAGHHEGMKTVKKITKSASRLGVKVLTLYAFSTENWKRPKSEVDYLMKLPEQFLNSFLPELIEENVRVSTMGNMDRLPESTKRAVSHAMEKTKDNDGLLLNFALNYGSRIEITEAIQQFAEDVKCGVRSPDEMNEELLSGYLMTRGLSDPDLLIRTSGEVRLSNFMLWQLAYTELYFMDVLWPDFSEEHLLEAIASYQSRSRRYGGLIGEEIQ